MNITFKEVKSLKEKKSFITILKGAALNLEKNKKSLWNISTLTIDNIFNNDFKYYIAFIDGQAYGTIILQELDLEFWADKTNDKSLYIHKLAIHPTYSGKGLSNPLLSFALTQAKELNKEFLRLDCRNNRKKLKNLYENFGFTLIDLIEKPDKINARYEIKLK